ncbi:phospholipase, patatin, partial [mine drainage metagenome]
VDGSASSAFLLAPGIASILPEKIPPLNGATVYLVINGRLRPQPITTRNHTTDILMRSLDTELASDSQVRVELAYSFAQHQGVRLKVAAIPASYRLHGLIGNLEPARMKALFAYGERCARENRVWTDALTVLNDVAHVRPISLAEAVRCPVAGTAGKAAARSAGTATDRGPTPFGPRGTDGRPVTLVSTPGG